MEGDSIQNTEINPDLNPRITSAQTKASAHYISFKIFIPFFVIIVITVSGVYLAIHFTKRNEVTHKVTSSMPSLVSNNSWLTYKNPLYSYTIQYPSSVAIAPLISDGNAYTKFYIDMDTAGQKNSPELLIHVWDSASEGYETLDKFMQSQCALNEACKVYSNATNITISGKAGKKIGAFEDIGGIDLETIYFKDGRYTYEIELYGTPNQEQLRTMNRMVQSFTLHDQNQSESVVSQQTMNELGFSFKYPMGWKIFFQDYTHATYSPDQQRDTNFVIYDLYPVGWKSPQPESELEVYVDKPMDTIQSWMNTWEVDAGGSSIANDFTIDNVKIGNKNGYHLVPKNPKQMIGEGTYISDIYVVLTKKNSYSISLDDTLQKIILPNLLFK